MASQANSTKHAKKSLYWSGSFPKTFYEAKLDKDNHQKRKLQANTFDEYWCKNSQQNISKPNPKTHRKDCIPQPSGIHPRFTRMVQHRQINVIQHINRRQKPHDHLLDAEKVSAITQHSW